MNQPNPHTPHTPHSLDGPVSATQPLRARIREVLAEIDDINSRTMPLIVVGDPGLPMGEYERRRREIQTRTRRAIRELGGSPGGAA